MKFILTESQYKIIVEDQSTIDVNAFKQNLDDLVQKYCSPIPVNQEFLNQGLKNVQLEISESIDRRIENLNKEITIPVLKSDILDIIKTYVKPILMNKATEIYKSKFGLQEPIDYSKTLSQMLSTLFSKVYEKLNSGLKYKLLLKTFITPKNVNQILKSFDENIDFVSNQLKELLTYLLLANPTIHSNIVAGKSGKQFPCKKLRVVVNSSGTKLKPNEYYNPSSPVTVKDGVINTNVNLDNIILPYKNKIVSIIKQSA